LLGVDENRLAGGAFAALLRARRTCSSASFRGLSSVFRRHSDGDDGAEITTLIS
jgi:hypothetical protein